MLGFLKVLSSPECWMIRSCGRPHRTNLFLHPLQMEIFPPIKYSLNGSIVHGGGIMAAGVCGGKVMVAVICGGRITADEVCGQSYVDSGF